MTVRKAHAIILEAVHAITDSYGAPSDQAKVKSFLADPAACPLETYIYVGRLGLGNFYAFSSNAFDKNSLWQEIQKQSGLKQMPHPKKWGIDSRVNDLALWVHAHATEK